MKIALLFAVILYAATAAAETIIIEYPDHYYVESTGTPEAKPASSPESSSPPVKDPPGAGYEGRTPSATARPVTSFEGTSPHADPSERRAAMESGIQRLQRERGELLTPREGETSEQSSLRQQQAAGMLRRINKMSSELLKMSQP